MSISEGTVYMLKVDNISASYGDLKVLFDFSIHVDEGEIVSLVGSNGAGKTTLLRVISRLMPVTAGSVTFNGEDLLSKKPSDLADIGIAHIPQGRGILTKLSVKDNLILGAYAKRTRANMDKNMEWALETFPILKERLNKPAGSLSGGEQQMLSLSRALMMEPKLIMMDEPSLGLAPIVVDEVFDIIGKVANQGMAILLVEQNLMQALSIAHRGYVIETGQIVFEGPAKELLENPDIKKAYLSV